MIFRGKVKHLSDGGPDTAGGGRETAAAEEKEDHQETDSQTQDRGIARRKDTTGSLWAN